MLVCISRSQDGSRASGFVVRSASVRNVEPQGDASPMRAGRRKIVAATPHCKISVTLKVTHRTASP